MAPPEPPSPSASSTLLPFLVTNGSRARRGSLASLQSNKGEIDRDVLAQALDDIHISASKSEALTSFHDYDGGAPQAGAKELVSSGITGLYDKLKRGLTNSTLPVKDAQGKGHLKGGASRDSIDTQSLQSEGSARKPQVLKAVAPDAASLASNASLFESPTPASPAGLRSKGRSSVEADAGSLRSFHATGTSKLTLVQDELANEPAPEGLVRVPTILPPVSSADLDKARDAMLNDDPTTAASQALARVLSHHDVGKGDMAKLARASSHNRASHSDVPNSALADGSFGPPSTQVTEHGSALAPGPAIGGVRSNAGEMMRPPMLHIGPSHLPGYAPSRASSASGGERASQSSSQATIKKPAFVPSANINTALQRRRTERRPPPRPAEASQRVPTHLRRRVLSKTFWMKDENAKDCFYCGQPFSTFRRKHHCRTCGQIFDAKCTTLVPGRPFGQPGTIRLCRPCESIIYGSDDDSTVFSDEGADYQRSPLPRGSFGEDDDFTGKMDGIDDLRDTFPEVATPSIGIPASRRNREAKRRSAVIEFDASPAIPRPASSHSLISLARRPRSSSHRRFNSRHQLTRGIRPSVDERVPFQPASLDGADTTSALPAFHNDNIIDPDLAAFLSDEGSDDEGQQNIFAALSDGKHASPGDRERFGYSGIFTSAMKKGRIRAGGVGKSIQGDEALSLATKHLPKLSRIRNPSMGSMSNIWHSPRRSRSQTLYASAMKPESFERKQNTDQFGYNVSRTKIVRSSAMHGKDAPPIELNRASLDHLRNLLDQLLKDHDIQSPQAWQKALMPILLQCTDDVEPNVQLGDDMDIRHYIKLKKVPGGRPGDTSYVSGVVFSKNIALKSMARSISFPRIAVVTFAIEYARHHTHFMSLEPVIAQEQEYLRNLVARISALRPQVLLVQKNVSGSALGMLEKAGITVAYNIKESVLAAVARVTQTTMIKSVDKLAIDPSHLGICESFEVKTFVHDGLRKTYVYLSGCQQELGCTLILRGADTKILRRIKRITEFMCYVAYNLKLETNYLRDEFVSIPTNSTTQIKDKHRMAFTKTGDGMTDISTHSVHGKPSEDLNGTSNSNQPQSKYEQLELSCDSRILSASPFVVFMHPFMLTQLRDSERRLTEYRRLRDQYATADEEGDVAESSKPPAVFKLVQPEMVRAPPSKDQPKVMREYLHAVHQAQYDKTMHTYETQRRLMESFLAGPINPFDPHSHQSIIVLHSTVSTLNSAPCIGPEQLGIGFYAGYNHVEPNFEEDCTLGQYVEDLCVSANSKCKECEKKMLDHHRQYVHGYGQLSIATLRQPAKLRGYERTILMWSTCRICKQETTVTPMSDNTWKYSFAKYLELSFWASPLHPRAGLCQHDVHKDFFRFFGFEDLAVRVQYDPIAIYDVVVPRSKITWKVESDLVVKNEQYLHFVNRLKAFTDSIKKRLNSINVDTLDEKKSMEANDYLDELRNRAQRDHTELLQKLQQKYADSRYYELIPLNRALRFMDEKALKWDDVFNDFERDYFPSETDIRKLATLQLKNMFLESAQPPTSTVVSDASDDEDGSEMKPVMHRARTSPPSNHELLSEKAHNVLSSTLEEHRGSIADVGDVQAVVKDECEEQLGSSLARQTSPREEQEQAVQRDEVKHLDLAVPADLPEQSSPTEQLSTPDEEPKKSSRPSTRDSQATDEPFATQTKPLATGLLERIEQIRSNRVGNEPDSNAIDSKIPRLADLKRTEVQLHTLSSPAPPLLRAQSSPAPPQHSHRRSTDLNSEHSIDAITSGAVPESALHHLEKRIGEKLGVNRIVSKVGKVAPSLIPRSIPSNVPSKEDVNSTKVSALAKHFEQMSREFERERLRERKQRALRSRQARANPLASSTPVVEVYRNTTEAVGGRHLDSLIPKTLQELQDARKAPEADDAATQSVDFDQRDVADVNADPTDYSQEEVPLKRDQSPAPSDAESESSDTESKRTRPRDVSDPTSTTISSGLMSPTTSVPDIDLHPELSIPEHRKNVWFNYLAEFWSKRSASGWSPLEYPLHAIEHVFEDSDIIVREDEPSSVIALSLACADYQVKVQDFRSHPKKHKKQPSASTSTGDIQQQAVEASLLSDTGTHMKYSFAHGQVKASCKIFYAESFDALRRRCDVADRFVESLSRCLKYDSKGGKTKSLFLKTLDNRFIIKSLQEVEVKAFTKFAPDYFAFMSHTLFHGVPSVIAKMFGLFQVSIKNPATGMDFSYYLLVMENLFYDRNPNRRFDLKGSMRNRKIESTGQPDEVLLDENLVETIFESPLFVREHARRLLQASVWNDTMWLCKQNVMDYSLMAGFDDERKELIVGIIDCIRTYTWDKKLESWIKDRGKNKPTITSPKDYRNRFRVSMMQYVLQAPNCWHQFQAQMAAPKTLRERDDVGDASETEREKEGEVRRSEG